MIISNQVKCLSCEDTPFSGSVHDFKYCKCGAIAVDGGQEYLRRVGEINNIEEMSISAPDEVVDALKDALEWCEDTGRNNLGIICAFFRVLRDNGYDLNVEED